MTADETKLVIKYQASPGGASLSLSDVPRVRGPCPYRLEAAMEWCLGGEEMRTGGRVGGCGGGIEKA